MRKTFLCLLSLWLIVRFSFGVLAQDSLLVGIGADSAVLSTSVTVIGSEEASGTDPVEDESDESETATQVFLSEILADPTENDGENEFIELYNAGTEPVDLFDWILDDAREEDGRYYFDNPALDYVLEPDSYLVLFRPETDITLNNDKDKVILFDPDGHEADRFEYMDTLSGYSWGRSPDDREVWVQFKTPTPGLANVIEPNLPPVAVIDVQQDTRLMKLNVTGESSHDPDGDKLTYFWQFEEGATDDRSNPTMYEYSEPGDKTVTLTVTDVFGDSDTAEYVFSAALESEPEPPADTGSGEDGGSGGGGSDSGGGSGDTGSGDSAVIPEAEITYHVYINEVLADPAESDADNEFIELYNAGTESVDLIGWRLDDARAEGGYSFAETEGGHILEPGAYLSLLRPQTGIVLNNDSEIVRLFDDTGAVVDLVEFNSPGSGRSWGRHPEDPEEWRGFKTPTPGSVNLIEPNQVPVAVIEVQKDSGHMKLNVTGEESYDTDGDKLSFLWEFEPGVFDERENPLIYEYDSSGEKTVRLTITDSEGGVGTAEITFSATEKSEAVAEPQKIYPHYSLINEFLPAPDGPDTENEWVELFNPNSYDIDLSGWYLDDAEGKSSPYKIDDGTQIRAKSFLVFSEPGLGLSLKNSEDEVRLLDPNGGESQVVTYAGAEDEFSYAKTEAGEFKWTPLLTPGSANDFPPPPKAYLPGAVVFESVLPNPEGTDSGFEAVVLKNTLAEDVSLSGWSMMDASGKTRELPEVVVPAGGVVSLLSSEFKLSLNNSNEQLTLFDPVGNVIDKIRWRSSASGQWLINPDSLQDGMQASVLRTVDGDTLVIDYAGKKLTVRLLGVDTPETVHPFKPVEYYGKQASAYLDDRLTGQSVTLEFDEDKIDKYGRVLAYVFVGDEMINRSILSEGYGFAYTRFSFKYLEEFIALEAEARDSGLGLWKDPDVRQMVEDYLKELEELEEDLDEEGELDDEELIMESDEEDEQEGIKLMPKCNSSFLKIDAIVPNPQRGEAVEYIRLINTGADDVCLYGWSLDDVPEGGSKPFLIQGGSIAGGARRTFRKQETDLTLNNKDDCATLIAPGGTVADQICYERTHKNEVFTHAGGDWVPKKRTKKASSSKSKTLRHRFKRDFISYQSDLETQIYYGRVISIEEDAETFELILEAGDNLIGISYAESPIDVAAVRQLIDFTEPVEVDVYESGGVRHLVAIRPAPKSLPQEAARGIAMFLSWLLILLMPAGFYLFYRRKRI